MGRKPRNRHLHRAIAIVFTPTVAASFAAMPWGQPPAWLTYSPLPPLLVLMATGLAMLVSSWTATARDTRAAREGAEQ